MLKKLIPLLIILLSIIGCVPKTPEIGYTVKIPSQKIEKQLKKHFPLIEETDSLVIKLENPTVKIENRKVYTGITIKIKTPLLIILSGKAYISGNIKYKPETGRIYLVNPSIEYLAINGKVVVSSNMPQIKEILNDIIKSTFKKTPIYTLKKSYRKQVKSIKLSERALLVKIGF
ncbi:DUF1439 domain-containing protein [Desulfurobacterium indicum]|uniref:DUF1439 domain-containing protein n=1 Tax=Desulfurobacterium indicum TaxID=1914305 RepID=A0A1R1MN47_9BACT|nr:DUF1439 domain-containing protein [Desulfurobacterium indicum]OMH41183.1 hypothetical protein BLW93_01450 [Desulfurobacterium indicum]